MSDKKRKNEDGALKPKKAPKLDLEASTEAAEPPSSAKAKLAAFRHDQENSEKVEQEVTKENELPEEPEVTTEEAVVKDAKKKPTKSSEDDEASKFSGLLKMPFKKKEKKAVEKKVSEDDIDLEDDCAILEVNELEENQEKVLESKDGDSEEDLSMTEKWASFHEENPNAVEPVPKKEKKTRSSEEKKKKVKEVSSPKSAKSGGKPGKVEVEAAEDKPEVPVEAATKPEKKPAEKEGPLTKFFKVKSKSKLPSVIPAEDADIEMTGMRSVATPLRSSPRKKPTLSSTPASSTPNLATSTPTTASPFEPGKVRAVAVAKLTVSLNELKAEMEEAVAASDFLRAHEKKQAVLRVEEELRAAEEGTAAPAPSRQQAAAGVSPASPSTPLAAPSAGRKVTAVATPGSASPMAARKLTPGQLKKKEEIAKKKEALEAEKTAKKEEIARKKEEAAKKKEEERLEKERKKEVEKRAREVALREKEIEKEKKAKEEEREKKKAEKELQNKAKEEEKAKKDEEKKLLEAAEKEKELKKAQAFKSFFKKDVAKEEALEKRQQQEEGRGNFGVLLPRATMRLAPVVRGDPELARRRLDALDTPSGPEGLYLALLKAGHAPGSQPRTWPYHAKVVEDEEDVTVIEDDEEEGGELDLGKAACQATVTRAKLLQFHDNQRPAYWGTWGKASAKVAGRRPFARDTDRFDYDYDSDDDWEEEEEGEDLGGDDEKDAAEAAAEGEGEDYEVDNEFFVPHGYLSDGEEEKDEDEVFDPEAAKEKLKLKEQEFEAEQKKKTRQLKPRLWGVYWEDELDTDAAAGQLLRILGSFAAVGEEGNNNLPIETGLNREVEGGGEELDISGVTESGGRVKVGRGKARPVPEEAMPDLVRLVHKNVNNKMFLAREFIEFWQRKTGGEAEGEGGGATPSAAATLVSKRAAVTKILEVASWSRQDRIWTVRAEVLEQVGHDGSTPNDWTYILPQSNRREQEAVEVRSSRPPSPVPAPATNLITKFAKVLTKEEKEEQAKVWKAKMEKEAAASKLRKEEQLAEKLARDDHARRREARKALLL